MSKNIKNSKHLLLWLMLPLFVLVSCEDYEDQTFVLSDQEQIACDMLADTLNVQIEAADLRFFGPTWTGKNMENNLKINERIGVSWFDADILPEPDVFVFIEGADTLAAMQILNFVYDETLEQVDSIEIAYKYNPVGKPSFAGLSSDTVLVVATHNAPVYLDFSQGVVTASGDWNIMFNENSIGQSETGKVHRLEDANLAGFTTAPPENYATDGLGFDIAMDYLTSNSVYLTVTDSLLAVTLEADEDAGYLLWDRQNLSSSEIIFHADNYMTIAIWDEAGEILSPTDESISMQTVAYCHNLKTRVVYELEDSLYLIQFRPHEEMTEKDFFLALLEGE